MDEEELLFDDLFNFFMKSIVNFKVWCNFKSVFELDRGCVFFLVKLLVILNLNIDCIKIYLLLIFDLWCF